MLYKLPEQYKRRFKIVAFVVLPILFLVGFILSISIADQLNYIIDPTGIIILSLSYVPLYFLCLYVVYQKIVKMPPAKRTE
jgi:hypothetical protein